LTPDEVIRKMERLMFFKHDVLLVLNLTGLFFRITPG